MARALEELRVRVRRLEQFTGVDREEPDTLPGIAPTPSESPVIDAFADALGALGFLEK